jgi:hypothetical protein
MQCLRWLVPVRRNVDSLPFTGFPWTYGNAVVPTNCTWRTVGWSGTGTPSELVKIVVSVARAAVFGR